MLIRVSGGNDGIKEYLEKGIKSGREQSRDVLDERVVLSGDLELTDSVISMMENKGQERYLHITLSFKEDHIDNDTLVNIVNDFENYTLNAFEKDEYNFYAEAHLPKVKSYIDQKTGEEVKRYPHIHIVIPEKNLLSDRHLNPLGMYDKNIDYFQAIQESINRKYGLSSPEDNRRNDIVDKSDIISRYKGDLYGVTKRDLKEQILNNIVNKDIKSWESFKSELALIGSVTVRNEGKPNEYLNLKLPDEKRGINLKESVFLKNFIEDREGAGKVKDSFIENNMNEWIDKRSHEIKHIFKGSQKLRSHYSSLSDSEKVIFLKERETNHQEKYRGSNGREDKPITRNYPAERRVDREGRDRTSSKRDKPDITIDSKKSLAVRRNSMRELPERDVVRDEDRSKMLLPNNVSNNMVGQGRRIDNELRRDVYIEGSGVKPLTYIDTVTNQYIDRSNEVKDSVYFSKIKKELNPTDMLNELSHTHGIDTKKYEIKEMKDGSFRITVGNRNHNVSDFLTKELNLKWVEAKIILTNSYNKQVGGNSKFKSRSNIDKTLWADFNRNYKKEMYQSKSSLIKSLNSNYKNDLKDIKSGFRSKKNELYKNKKLSFADRKATLSILQMNKIKEEMILKEKLLKDKLSIGERFDSKELFKDYLVNKANLGSNPALHELRKHQTLEVRMDNSNGISSAVDIKMDFNIDDWKKNHRLSIEDLNKMEGIPNNIIDNIKSQRESLDREGASFGKNENEFTSNVATERARLESEKEAIKTAESFAKNKTIDKLNNLNFTVNKDGSVEYLSKGQPILKDTGKRIDFINKNADKETLEVGLRLAVEKYGSNVKLHGSNEYKEQMVSVAAEKGINVTFTDERLNEMLKQKKQELSQDVGVTNSIEKGRDPIKEQDKSPVPDLAKAEKLTGILLEHGAAHYQFNEKNQNSYYAKVETDMGVKTIWGSHIQKSLNEHKIGDKVSVEIGDQKTLSKDLTQVQGKKGDIDR